MEYIEYLEYRNCSINICPFTFSWEVILYNGHKVRLWKQKDSSNSCVNLGKGKIEPIYSSLSGHICLRRLLYDMKENMKNLAQSEGTINGNY